MHPAVPYAVAYGPDIASWMLKHASDMGEAFASIAKPVTEAITGRSVVIDRIGPALVSMQDGQTQVLSLLHRQSDSLTQINTAIDHVLTGQAAIAGGINLLTSLSLVGLGFSALSQGALLFQINALSRRMKQIGGEVTQIKDMMGAAKHADLAAGLQHFKIGLELMPENPDSARQSFHQAIGLLVGSSAFYSAMLQADGAASREYAWMLSRHLTTACLAQTACHLQIHNARLAVNSLEQALPLLRIQAAAVFQRTVNADPAKFLMPMMAARGITLDALAELFRQAGLAEIVGPEHRQSSSELFERLRGEMSTAHDPRFFAKTVWRITCLDSGRRRPPPLRR